MRWKGYEIFDLMLEKLREVGKARVLNSPAGQSSVAFELPICHQDRELLRRIPSRQPNASHQLESLSSEPVKSLGKRLFDAVFAGEVGICFHRSLDYARGHQHGLRICLRLTDAGEWADLPWELLYDSSRNRFLSLSTETPICRYLDLPDPVLPAAKPPIRVLVVTCVPTDCQPLEAEQECEHLSKALIGLRKKGTLDLCRLCSATLEQLDATLREQPCHVLHFIGHGRFDLQSEKGFLTFVNEKGQRSEVGAHHLAALVREHQSLRLVVLNSCETGRSLGSDPFTGAAQSLLQQGVPAVVAMQHKVSDSAAINFGRQFYEALADGLPVDAAAADARRAVCFGLTQSVAGARGAQHEDAFACERDIDWTASVVFMRSQHGRLFELSEERPPLRTRQGRPILFSLVALFFWLALRFQPFPPETVCAIVITDESAAKLEGIANKPISLRALAKLVEAIAEKSPQALAIDVDLGSDGRLQEEVQQFADVVGRLPFLVVVPHGSAPAILQQAEGIQGSVHLQAGSRLLGEPLTSAAVQSFPREVPLSLALADTRIPMLARQALLPINAYQHLSEVAVLEAFRLPERGTQFIKDRLVILGGVLERNREEEERDLHWIVAPPWSGFWNQRLPGARVHALFAGYAASDGLLWSVAPAFGIAAALIIILIGCLRPRAVKMAAPLTYLLLAVGLRIHSGIVLPMWPIWALVAFDTIAWRWIWPSKS